jgi:hypothetical protein
MPYLKGDSPSLLEANVPKITQAYITSRYAVQGSEQCLVPLAVKFRKNAGSFLISDNMTHVAVCKGCMHAHCDPSLLLAFCIVILLEANVPKITQAYITSRYAV